MMVTGSLLPSVAEQYANRCDARVDLLLRKLRVLKSLAWKRTGQLHRDPETSEKMRPVWVGWLEDELKDIDWLLNPNTVGVRPN